MRLLAASLAAMSLAAGACASNNNSVGSEGDFPRYGTTPVGRGGATVEVSSNVSVTVPAGAVADGAVRVSQVRAHLPDPEWFVPEGVAVDLEVTSDLLLPAQVRFAGDAPEGSLAAILHYEAEAGWVPVAVGDPGEDAVLNTTTFSAHLFGFIPIPDWLGTKADSVSGAVRTIFQKRSPGPTCEASPDWIDHSPASIDAVLSCVAPATDENAGTPEAELRLVNNRGYAIEVGVPSAARYAWVNGQPEPIRAAVRSLARADVVWLMPGQLMTVGLTRPNVGQVVEVPARVTAQTILVGYLEDALAQNLGPLGVVHVLGQCSAWSDLPLDLSPVDASLISVFTVAKDCFSALAADPVRLLTISNAIRGQTSTAADVSRLAGTLRVAAGAIAAVDQGADLMDLIADNYVNPATGGPDGYTTIVGLRPQRPVLKDDQLGVLVLGMSLDSAFATGWLGEEVTPCSISLGLDPGGEERTFLLGGQSAPMGLDGSVDFFDGVLKEIRVQAGALVGGVLNVDEGRTPPQAADLLRAAGYRVDTGEAFEDSDYLVATEADGDSLAVFYYDEGIWAGIPQVTTCD